ncbi:MAG: tRNA epoxyqueuosine(34) reductase QueG [Verrucomicrobiales bacterium]
MANLRLVGLGLGFAEVRVAAAARADHADDFLEWIADGKHGEMAWLEKNPERRCDPREVLPGCRSVITLGLNYFPGYAHPNPAYRIARYSWNEDYHDLIGDKLKDLDLALQDMGGQQRYYVDTGPVLERDFASASGLGWNGKSCVQIHRKLGPWLFLAEVLTTLEFPPDQASRDYCGKCTACLDACPTQAITAPHQLDARRCISYLTIENHGPIPEEFRRAIGDHLYGCDDCLAVCPWNRFAQKSRQSQFHARTEIFAHSLTDFLALNDEAFRRLFKKSPIKRLKLPRFLRNVCVVLGNTGTPDDLPSLEKAAQHPDPLIAEHASWAIAEIKRRHAKIAPL